MVCVGGDGGGRGCVRGWDVVEGWGGRGGLMQRHLLLLWTVWL